LAQAILAPAAISILLRAGRLSAVPAAAPGQLGMYTMQPRRRPREEWFTRLFGFEERTGRDSGKTRANFDLEGTRLTSRANGREFEAGTFTTPSLGELRRGIDHAGLRKRLPGPLRVTEVIGDVSALHVQPENHLAAFQVASQFNCLEFVSTDMRPEDGVACYAYDMTQGPACATACGPATVVRNYFAFAGGGQSSQRQVENLADVEELLGNGTSQFFQVRSGYTLASDSSLGKLNPKLQSKELREAVKESLRIGVHADTQVTGCSFGKVELPPDSRQLVTQVLCSACSVSYSRASDLSWEPFASLVLEAAYEGTMMAAVQNALRHDCKGGSRKLFLTALGGGVFGNDNRWIVAAMHRAFEKFRGVGLEVVLVSYGQRYLPAARLLGAYQ